VRARLDRTERASFDFSAARYINYQLARGIALVILALVICLTVAPAGATAMPAMCAEPPRGMPTLRPAFVEGNGGAHPQV
jgi:hypothetical protein